MAQSRLFMRQIRELLRLHFDEGLSQRLIARSLGVVRSTVERVIKRFLACGLTWPLDPALSDADLEQRLYRGAAHVGSAKGCARPNYAEVVKQQVARMKRSAIRDVRSMPWCPTGPRHGSRCHCPPDDHLHC